MWEWGNVGMCDCEDVGIWVCVDVEVCECGDVGLGSV